MHYRHDENRLPGRKRPLSALALPASAVLLVCLASVPFTSQGSDSGAAILRTPDPGDGIPFYLEGRLWNDKKAFIDSGGRCATIAPEAADQKDIDNRLQGFLSSREAFFTAGRAPGSVTVQVWVHVINAGTGITNGDVPQSQIDDQISVLNSAYGGAYGGVDTPFRFVLAGVDRTTSPTMFSMAPGSTAEHHMKSLLHKGNAQTLNLYVVRPRGGTLAWSSFPWDYARRRKDDGVVLLYSTLPGGSAAPYNQGRTATHEIGHWLGLLHTFQNGCKQPGDHVADTPYESKPAYDCTDGRDTCPGKPGTDPVHNFMDYTDDGCVDQFTADQSARMDALTLQYRGL